MSKKIETAILIAFSILVGVIIGMAIGYGLALNHIAGIAVKLLEREWVNIDPAMIETCIQRFS